MARLYPTQPLSSCHALIRDGKRVLLIRRVRPPFAGFWSLPGGTIELGETAEAALAREVHEETGLIVATSKFLGYADAIEVDAASLVRLHYIILYFEATVVPDLARPGDDAGEVRWFSPEEVRRLQFTDSVDRCFQWVGL